MAYHDCVHSAPTSRILRSLITLSPSKNRQVLHSLSYSVRLFLFVLSVVLFDIYQVISFSLSQKEQFMSVYRKKMPKRAFSLAVMLMTFEDLGIITVHLK